VGSRAILDALQMRIVSCHQLGIEL
jgi:hypothetical protein